MDLSKLFYVFLALCQTKQKLKFDKGFKVSWRFCFELKVLNESNWSIVPLAMSFTSAFNSIDNALIQNPFPQFIIGLHSSLKPHSNRANPAKSTCMIPESWRYHWRKRFSLCIFLFVDYGEDMF